MTLFNEMVEKRSLRMLAMAGWAVWACSLPQNNPPGDVDAGPEGGTGSSGKGGTATGGASGTTTGGSTTGGTTTGGTTTGGSTTGGSGGSTGGSMAGTTSTGGTTAGMDAGGKGGTAAGMGGTTAGMTSGGKGGTAAGMGGTVGGMSAGGKGGTAGTMGGGGSGPTVCPCLVHRYSFSGSGTTATDSIGTAHGTITGGTQSGNVVTLSGTEQYVTLPAGILTGLTAATFEAWVTWTAATTNWQRIFDFGSNAGDSGDQGTVAGNASVPYIFLTPRAGGSTATTNCAGTANVPRVAITGAGPSMESCIAGSAAFPAGSTAMPTHVAVTVGSTMTLYVNGASVGMITPAVNLSGVSDTHNWLGRSQFAPDGEFPGTISEFRIYNTARTGAQIAASNTAGPDAPPAQ